MDEFKEQFMAIREAILAGGCFWCLDAVFRQLDGVIDVISGYVNSKTKNPTYKEVCTDTTGYAEAVKIIYDDNIISYRELLEVFYSVIDPTTLNHQGADFGSQYRSIIIYQNEEEKKIAKEVTKEAQKRFTRKIVTTIEPLKNFYEAESYHQNYFANNPNQGYCQIVIKPKVNKVKKEFLNRLKPNVK